MTHDKERNKDLNINNAADWNSLRQGWVREQSDRVQAYADRYFMTDDELPLHRHLILVGLFFFFVVFSSIHQLFFSFPHCSTKSLLGLVRKSR